MPKVSRAVPRVLAPLVALPVLAATLAGCGDTPRTPAAGWHLGWRAESVFPGISTATTTCRFVARLSASGSRVRVELTDNGGRRGYTVQAGWISTPTSLTSLDVQPGTSQQLRFNGATTVRVNGGATVLSDPLPYPVQANTGISVTLTASAGDAPGKVVPIEPGACTTGAPATAGTAPGRTFGAATPPRWIRSVLVDGPAQRSIVAFGDSITEGPTGYYNRWSDVLSAAGLPVVNAGVAGNALSTYGLFGSLPGVERAQELMNEPNVTDLAMLIGTNDLGFGISGTKLLASLDSVLSQARSRGIQVYVGTILPRTGYGWSAAQEAQRVAVNTQLRGTWLSSRGGIVVDTDAALRDPALPTRMLRAYDSGDGLHPDVVGAARIGRSFLAVMSPTTPPSATPSTGPSKSAPSASPTPKPTTPSTAPTSPAPSVRPAPSVTSIPTVTAAPSVIPTPSVTPSVTVTPSTTPAPSVAPSVQPVPSVEPVPPTDPSSSTPPATDPTGAELNPQVAGYLETQATVAELLGLGR